MIVNYSFNFKLKINGYLKYNIINLLNNKFLFKFKFYLI